MHITWYGQSYFQIIVSQGKNQQVSVVIDPFDKETGLTPPSSKAEVLLISHNHHDHNNINIVKGEPFIIDSPGEYEVKGVYVRGIPAFHDDVKGEKRGRITLYVIEAEGIRLCYLSDLGQKELTSKQLEEIGGVDILMVPVGGTYTIDSNEAASVVAQIEPRIVIPMHYHIPNLKIKLDGVDNFLKAIGKKNGEPQKKLLVKKKDLSESGIEVVVLQP